VKTFGITTGPYIFTKCLHPLVKFWRENGVKVVLYLDDGFGMGKDVSSCYEDAKFVKESLIEPGLFINEEKSVFKILAFNSPVLEFNVVSLYISIQCTKNYNQALFSRFLSCHT
jgi:hypothetical protein